MQRIKPCLWFDGQAEEAVNFYISVFKNSKINHIARRPEFVPGPSEVLTVDFTLDGQEFLALNGGPHFKFTEAISLMVNCETQAEIDEMWKKLSSGGGQEVECGWVKDLYGLSWQIVPSMIGEMLGGDPEKTARVMKEVMTMKKLDIDRIRRASEGKTAA